MSDDFSPPEVIFNFAISSTMISPFLFSFLLLGDCDMELSVGLGSPRVVTVREKINQSFVVTIPTLLASVNFIPT